MSQRRPFYGWTVLAVSASIICLGMGSLFSLGVFLKPIEDATGWSRSAISVVALLNWLSMGVGSVAGGAVHDRLGGYLWLYLGSGSIGLAAILLALTFRHPRPTHVIHPLSVTA